MKTKIIQMLEQAGGVLPFHQFMFQALYHPEKGYYTTRRQRLGPQGDFVTAPELTSLFGELLTLQGIELWQAMGKPRSFRFVEMGPGSGQLAEDILHTAQRFPTFFAALRYDLVEISQDYQVQQRQRLTQAGFEDKTRWFDDLPHAAAAEEMIGVIFGNEFLDALPVHRVEQTVAGLMEIGIRQTPSPDGPRDPTAVSPPVPAFQTTLLPLSDDLPADYFTARSITLPAGFQTEVGLVGQRWVQQAGNLLTRGAILLIDYGYPQKEYYAPVRRHGTLAGHRNHVRVEDPLDHVGLMDLTAHVDFTAILDSGRQSGLELLGYTTQGWFLMGLGILERLEQVAQSKNDADSRRLKETVMRLILPEGMGEIFKVMALGKKIGRPSLSGFRLQELSGRL